MFLILCGLVVWILRRSIGSSRIGRGSGSWWAGLKFME